MWNRFVEALAARKSVSLLVGVALLAGSGAFARKLVISADVTDALPPLTADTKAWLELSKRFDAFNSFIIGLEEPNAPMTAEGLEAVKRVTAALAAKKAEGVLNVASVTNVDSIRQADDGSLVTDLLISSIPKDEAALAELRAKVKADTKVTGALISEDQLGYMVLARVDGAKDGATLATLVQKTVEENRGPLNAHYFGAAFFTGLIAQQLASKGTQLGIAFVVLLLAALAFTVRAARPIIVVLISAAFTLVVWAGLAGLLGITISATSLTALLGVVALAAVAFSRGLGASAPAVVAAGVAAFALTWVAVPYVSSFGTVMALGAAATLLVGLFIYTPLSQPVERATHSGRVLFVPALVLTAVFGVFAMRAHFRATPQEMFSSDDAIGRALAFFDVHFKGADIIQIDFKGDLRDPPVAARLMRMTDLLEGTKELPDVRSVTQILGFLNKGFAGFQRIPTTRESMGNLWFFLEGREDVKQLVSGDRDEAMVVIRIPTVAKNSVDEFKTLIEKAAKDSLLVGGDGAKIRLHSIARSYALKEDTIDSTVDAAMAPLSPTDQSTLDAKIRANVKTWLASPDSPYAPTDVEWVKLEAALSAPSEERLAKLVAASTTFPDVSGHEQDFSETVLARVKDQQIAVRAESLVAKLGTNLPEAFVSRATGVIAEVLEPQVNAGEKATIEVLGLPMIAPDLQSALMSGLWRGLGMLVLIGALVLLLLSRQLGGSVKAALAAALASMLTLGTTGTFGFGVDSGSAALFLLPPSTTIRTGFLVAFGAASLAFLVVGLAPVSRIGLTLAIAFGASAAAAHVARVDRDAE
jgi:predicted RND superfamily exporter protein